MKWIETKKQKPPLDQHVLCGEWTRYSNTPWKTWIDIGVRFRSQTYNKICWSYNGDSDDSGSHEEDISGYPDYWMPLPELPPLTKEMLDREAKALKKERDEDIAKLKKEMAEVEKEYENKKNAKRR